MARGRDSVEGKRGRGRPPREPALLPKGISYADWRELHEPALEILLRRFEAEQLEWDAYEERCVKAVQARAAGLDVEDPVPPSPESSVFACLRLYGAALSGARRAELVAELEARQRRPMPKPVPTFEGLSDFLAWIVGEAMARGFACDFDSAYQAWFVFADLLLRDADIGAIVARVHPERLGRPASSSPVDQKIQNAALARQERKRVNAKRLAFGYSAA